MFPSATFSLSLLAGFASRSHTVRRTVESAMGRLSEGASTPLQAWARPTRSCSGVDSVSSFSVWLGLRPAMSAVNTSVRLAVRTLRPPPHRRRRRRRPPHVLATVAVRDAPCLFFFVKRPQAATGTTASRLGSRGAPHVGCPSPPPCPTTAGPLAVLAAPALVAIPDWRTTPSRYLWTSAPSPHPAAVPCRD